MKQQQAHQSPTHSIGGQRVRFPTNEEELSKVVCVLPHCHDLDPEESALIWYTKLDLQKGRSDAKLLSRQCSNDGHGRFLDGTFCEKSREAQEKLLAWTSRGMEDARGLERWVNKTHSEMRQDDQFKALMAVLEAQDSMVTYGEGPLDWEKLKKIYLKSSKNARHFARMIGKADSYAVAPDLRLGINNQKSMRTPRDGCDSDSVTTTTTTTATTKTDVYTVSPPKKIQTYLRINRKDMDLQQDSTHYTSPLKRFRNKIQGKKAAATKRLTERESLIEVQ